jgi:HSP20 family protein
MFYNTLLPAALHREMTRMLTEPATCGPACAPISHLIRGEVVEHENAWELVLDLPGMDREDVEVKLEGNELVVKGARNREALGEKDRLLHSSRLFGSFERHYRLSEEINLGKVSARMEKGVLRITLAKADQALPRKVEIQVN